MRTWNHRLVLTEGSDPDDPDYSVHEVHYDDGTPMGMSPPITFGGASLDEVVSSLERAAKSIREHGIFVPPAEWKYNEDADTEQAEYDAADREAQDEGY